MVVLAIKQGFLVSRHNQCSIELWKAFVVYDLGQQMVASPFKSRCMTTIIPYLYQSILVPITSYFIAGNFSPMGNHSQVWCPSSMISPIFLNRLLSNFLGEIHLPHISPLGKCKKVLELKLISHIKWRDLSM